MAVAGIRHGQKMRKHAVDTLLKGIDQVVNQDGKAQKFNLKHPGEKRTLFTDGAGVEEALELLSLRCYAMKTGEGLEAPTSDDA